MPRPVHVDEFDELCDELTKLARSIVDKKRPEYTLGDCNTLKNFDDIAERLHLRPAQVILTYKQKQDDALISNLTLGQRNSEPMEQRFADALNYLYILWVDYRRSQVGADRANDGKTHRYDTLED